MDTGFPSPPPAADPDPVWPPSPEDLAACCVVRLPDPAGEGDVHVVGGAPPVETLAIDGVAPPLPSALLAEPPPLRTEPPPLAVEPPAIPAEPPALRLDPPALPAAPHRRRSFVWAFPAPWDREHDNARMAWLAVLFAAACAIVSYAELSSGPWTAPLPAETAVSAAPGPEATPAGDASGDWPDPLVALYETRADAARPIKLRFSIVDPRKAASRARPAKRKPFGTVAEATPEPRLAPAVLRTPTARPVPADLPRWPSRPATLPPAATIALAAAKPVTPTPPPPAAPAPSPAPTSVSTPTPAPAAASARVAPPALEARVDPSPGDEERIRTTLARFSTAYSKLDASAARAVWPSVDVRALERAFDGLKSQELRFDRCNFTVEGARARAECTGRAVFVPRIGNQSPRSTSREWTFELKKADERWTIASARSS